MLNSSQYIMMIEPAFSLDEACRQTQVFDYCQLAVAICNYVIFFYLISTFS